MTPDLRIKIGAFSTDSSVSLNGVDISRLVSEVSVSCGRGPTEVTMTLISSRVSVEMPDAIERLKLINGSTGEEL